MTTFIFGHNKMRHLPDEMASCKVLRKVDLTYNEFHVINPIAMKQLTLESLELSANPYLHEDIVKNARLGMDNLIDYIHSEEYKEIYQRNLDKHPREKEKEKEKGKGKKAASPRRTEREEEDDDEGAADDDDINKDSE